MRKQKRLNNRIEKKQLRNKREQLVKLSEKDYNRTRIDRQDIKIIEITEELRNKYKIK